MPDERVTPDAIDAGVNRAFAMVSQALAQATEALLNADQAAAREVVENDRLVDELTSRVEGLVWTLLESEPRDQMSLRYLVSVLLILPELERSADLGEHIAQLALSNLGVEMSPVCRGVVQRMAEVALEMWRTSADAYSDRASRGAHVDETDVEMDILHGRLSAEIERDQVAPAVAAQLALLARFYERLGDHAVNLARRIERIA